MPFYTVSLKCQTYTIANSQLFKKTGQVVIADWTKTPKLYELMLLIGASSCWKRTVHVVVSRNFPLSCLDLLLCFVIGSCIKFTIRFPQDGKLIGMYIFFLFPSSTLHCLSYFIYLFFFIFQINISCFVYFLIMASENRGNKRGFVLQDECRRLVYPFVEVHTVNMCCQLIRLVQFYMFNAATVQ